MEKNTKIRTERNAEIFNLWAVQKLTFQQIADKPLQRQVSLKRIRNIIYAGPAKLKSDFERDVYHIFRLKFLELKNINASIWHVYENQPTVKLHEKSIRRIIKEELNKKHTINK